MSWQGVAAWVTVSCCIAGCGLIRDQWPRRAQEQGIPPTIGHLVDEVAGTINQTDGSIAVLGFRNDEGLQTAETRLLDDHLMDALLSRRAPVAAGVGMMSEGSQETPSWKADSVLPAGWQDLSPELLLSGKVHRDSPWAYVRLMLTERQSGAVLHTTVSRLTERELAGAAVEFTKLEPQESAEAAFVVNVDLHLILWRVTGSFTDLVLLEEGSTVAVGDRMQLRYSTDADCAVWAFLFRSDGVRHDLIDLNPVYAGHDQIASTFTFEAQNIVHTLYFVVAEELDADRGELFEEIGELIRRGEVKDFRGLDLVDGKLTDFLSSEAGKGAPVELVRSSERIELGLEEKFIIGEATLSSQPERLSGSPVLLRAISFDVLVQ